MLHRCSALVILLFGVAVLLADDDKQTKEKKKEANEVQGTLVKMDYAKKAIRLKTEDGEKDYPLANDATVGTPGGNKLHLFGKGKESEVGAREMLGYARRPGTHLKLTLANDGKIAREICVLFPGSEGGTNKSAGGPPKSGKPDTEKKTPDKSADKTPDKSGK